MALDFRHLSSFSMSDSQLTSTEEHAHSKGIDLESECSNHTKYHNNHRGIPPSFRSSPSRSRAVCWYSDHVAGEHSANLIPNMIFFLLIEDWSPIPRCYASYRDFDLVESYQYVSFVENKGWGIRQIGFRRFNVCTCLSPLFPGNGIDLCQLL